MFMIACIQVQTTLLSTAMFNSTATLQFELIIFSLVVVVVSCGKHSGSVWLHDYVLLSLASIGYFGKIKFAC